MLNTITRLIIKICAINSKVILNKPKGKGIKLAIKGTNKKDESIFIRKYAKKYTIIINK